MTFLYENNNRQKKLSNLNRILEGVLISDELTCSFCGTKISIDDVYCNNCGTSLIQDKKINSHSNQSNLDYHREEISLDNIQQTTNNQRVEAQFTQQSLSRSYSPQTKQDKMPHYFTRISIALACVSFICSWFIYDRIFIMVIFFMTTIVSAVIGLTGSRWKKVAAISLVLTSIAIIIFLINVVTDGIIADIFT
ncbi:MAG: zinc-ribbon domain-containing protein [Candidatus Thorarchaeota archaeon]